MVFIKSIEIIESTNVIDPETSEILENHDIIINNGQIIGIEPSRSTPSENGIDGSNLFAIPGLIDSHVHALNFLHDKVPGIFDLKWVFRQQKKNLSAYIKSGVTTVRDMGSALKLIRKISRKAANFEIKSPRILYAGPLFTVPHGYPYFIEKVPLFVEWIAGPLRIDLKAINGEKQARRMVDKVAKAGASCIKIAYQSVKYDNENSEIPILPLSLVRVIVDQGHKHNLPVAIHCCYRRDFQKLLDATDINFDSIEHIVIDEVLNQEEIQKFAQRNIPISTTLMTYGVIDHVERLSEVLEQEPERFEKKPLEFLKFAVEKFRAGQTGEISFFIGSKCIETGSKVMRKNLKKLLDAGVKIVYATDSAGAITPPGCPHWELIDMVRTGLKPLEALKTVTSVAADVIGMPNLGRLQVGKTADIVLLKQNPLDNVEHIRKVAFVIREGKILFKNN